MNQWKGRTRHDIGETHAVGICHCDMEAAVISCTLSKNSCVGIRPDPTPIPHAIVSAVADMCVPISNSAQAPEPKEGYIFCWIAVVTRTTKPIPHIKSVWFPIRRSILQSY